MRINVGGIYIRRQGIMGNVFVLKHHRPGIPSFDVVARLAISSVPEPGSVYLKSVWESPNPACDIIKINNYNEYNTGKRFTVLHFSRVRRILKSDSKHTSESVTISKLILGLIHIRYE